MFGANGGKSAERTFSRKGWTRSSGVRWSESQVETKKEKKVLEVVKKLGNEDEDMKRREEGEKGWRGERKVAGLHFRYCLSCHFSFIFLPWHLPQPFYPAASFFTLFLSLYSFFFPFIVILVALFSPCACQHNKPTVILQY